MEAIPEPEVPVHVEPVSEAPEIVVEPEPVAVAEEPAAPAQVEQDAVPEEAEVEVVPEISAADVEEEVIVAEQVPEDAEEPVEVETVTKTLCDDFERLTLRSLQAIVKVYKKSETYNLAILKM